jgi:hypothetical protein
MHGRKGNLGIQGFRDLGMAEGRGQKAGWLIRKLEN